jgi:hypothetical protein
MNYSKEEITNEIIKRIIMKPYSLKTITKHIDTEFKQVSAELEANFIRNAILSEPALPWKMCVFTETEPVVDVVPKNTFEVWEPTQQGKSSHIMLKALQEIYDYRVECVPTAKKVVDRIMADYWCVPDSALKIQPVGMHPEFPTREFNLTCRDYVLNVWQLIVLEEVGTPIMRAEWDKFVFYCDRLRERNRL